jgi:drug/metabolite transporter (DMT)-like permease
MNIAATDTPPAAAATSRRVSGLALAFVAASVSGLAIFVNGLAVKQFSDAVVYTTAKNSVAAVLLAGILAAGASRQPRTEPRPPLTSWQWGALLAVGVVGGGGAFALFFEGLARASSVEAAFIQKTLVVWVMVLAVPLLHERIGPLHLGAVALLVAGQALLAGHVGNIRLGTGELMIIGATLIWAGETVLAKRLLESIGSLPLGLARMAIGLVALLSFLAIAGRAGGLWGLSAHQWSLAGLNGAILATYVGTWFTALRRAQAVDVTAVLVFGAVITALLSAGFQAKPLSPNLMGLGLVTVGAALACVAALRRPVPSRLGS